MVSLPCPFALSLPVLSPVEGSKGSEVNEQIGADFDPSTVLRTGKLSRTE